MACRDPDVSGSTQSRRVGVCPIRPWRGHRVEWDMLVLTRTEGGLRPVVWAVVCDYRGQLPEQRDGDGPLPTLPVPPDLPPSWLFRPFREGPSGSYTSSQAARSLRARARPQPVVHPGLSSCCRSNAPRECSRSWSRRAPISTGSPGRRRPDGGARLGVLPADRTDRLRLDGLVTSSTCSMPARRSSSARTRWQQLSGGGSIVRRAIREARRGRHRRARDRTARAALLGGGPVVGRWLKPWMQGAGRSFGARPEVCTLPPGGNSFSNRPSSRPLREAIP